MLSFAKTVMVLITEEKVFIVECYFHSLRTHNIRLTLHHLRNCGRRHWLSFINCSNLYLQTYFRNHVNVMKVIYKIIKIISNTCLQIYQLHKAQNPFLVLFVLVHAVFVLRQALFRQKITSRKHFDVVLLKCILFVVV